MTEKQTFTLWPDQDLIRQNAIKAIETLSPEVVWEVVIKRHTKSKTTDQRSWFHALCSIFAEQLDMQAGDMKEIAKSKLFGWKQISYGGITLTLADGHSEELNAKQYSELIETLYVLAGETGIVLPEPDRFR